jgi:hypothetical protein
MISLIGCSSENETTEDETIESVNQTETTSQTETTNTSGRMSNKEFIAFCQDVRDTAEVIYSQRQQGAEMEKMLEIEYGNPVVDNMMHNIVLSAYEEPRMLLAHKTGRGTPAYEFAQKVYKSCLKAK